MRAGGAAVLAALLVAAGCGGGDGPSRETFTAKAQRICRGAQASLQGLARRTATAQRSGDPDRVYRELAALTRQAQRPVRDAIDRVDALDKPAGDRDRLKEWIATKRREVALTGELAAAFGARDQTRVATLSERIDALAQRADAFARAYGMPACGLR